jgi:hypothetical protein
LLLAAAGFFGATAGAAVVAGRSGSGAGLSSWHPDTTKTETQPTTSAMTWRDMDEIRMSASLERRLIASTPVRGDIEIV